MIKKAIRPSKVSTIMTAVAIIILVGVGSPSDCGTALEETEGVADSAMAAVDEAVNEASVVDDVDASTARAAAVTLEMMVLVLLLVLLLTVVWE